MSARSSAARRPSWKRRARSDEARRRPSLRDKPEPKAQRNFTDPDSRIMKDGASKAFEQCYNAQAAVDEEAQIIVAAEVTQETNDKQQVAPMVAALRDDAGSQRPGAGGCRPRGGGGGGIGRAASAATGPQRR